MNDMIPWYAYVYRNNGRRKWIGFFFNKIQIFLYCARLTHPLSLYMTHTDTHSHTHAHAHAHTHTHTHTHTHVPLSSDRNVTTIKFFWLIDLNTRWNTFFIATALWSQTNAHTHAHRNSRITYTRKTVNQMIYSQTKTIASSETCSTIVLPWHRVAFSFFKLFQCIDIYL